MPFSLLCPEQFPKYPDSPNLKKKKAQQTDFCTFIFVTHILIYMCVIYKYILYIICW